MGLELQSVLPELLPGFHVYPVPKKPLGPYRWVMLRLFGRLTSSERTIWLSDGRNGMPCLIEVLAHVYAGPRYAARASAANRFDPQTISRLIDPPPTVATRPNGRVVLQWQRDSLRFTDLSGTHASAVIAAMAVAREVGDDPSILSDLLDEMQTRVDARGFSSSGTIHPAVWQGLLVLPTAFAGGVLAAIVSLTIWDPAGQVILLAGLALGLFALSLYPRILRRRSRREKVWRTALMQGDTDGTIRSALASIGVQLPEP